MPTMALRGVLAALAAVAALAPMGAAAQSPVVERADLDGVINSVMADYIGQTVSRATAAWLPLPSSATPIARAQSA